MAAFEANHCGTSDRFLLVFFGGLRKLCATIFFFNDHPSLTLALGVTVLQFCKLFWRRSIRLKAA